MTEDIRSIRTSLEWRHLRRHIDAMIEKDRATLEGPLDHNATTYIRGRITVLRRLIGDVEDTPRFETDDGPS